MLVTVKDSMEREPFEDDVELDILKALMHRVKAAKFAITYVQSDNTENNVELDNTKNDNTTPAPPVKYSGNSTKLEDDVQFCQKTDLECLTHNVELEERKIRRMVSRKTSTGVYRNVYKMVRILACPAWLGSESRLGISESGGNSSSERESKDAATSSEIKGLKRKSRK